MRRTVLHRWCPLVHKVLRKQIFVLHGSGWPFPHFPQGLLLGLFQFQRLMSSRLEPRGLVLGSRPSKDVNLLERKATGIC